MCDVPLCENTTPLNALNEHSEIVVNSDDDNSSSDDDSPYGEDIEYVDASPPDVEIVSLEVLDDTLREKLLNVNLLIAKIDSLRDNPTPSSEVVIKSTSTFPNLFLEETNTFDNSSPEAETFCFDLEEISSGSTTTRSDYSLPDYEAFYSDDDHIKEKNSELMSRYIPPVDRSDLYHEEFADELTHIMSLPNLECFKFKIEPDPGDLTSIDLGIRKNASTTNVNVPLEDDQSSLFAYVVWIFSLAFPSRIPRCPIHIFSPPGMKIPFLTPAFPFDHSFMPDVSHRSGTFMKFNDFPDCEDSRASGQYLQRVFTSSAYSFGGIITEAEQDVEKKKMVKRTLVRKLLGIFFPVDKHLAIFFEVYIHGGIEILVFRKVYSNNAMRIRQYLSMGIVERIFKKRTKNKAKTTKPDSDWKSLKKSTKSQPKSTPKPKVKKNKFKD
ncbi:hypothetical protein Tco_0700387 [Tanacetum coccineum]